MSLNFPNRSRSYDARHGRVRFWGYDSAIEVAFFLDEDALFRLVPGTRSNEAEVLKAFDASRSRIMEIAAKVYARNRLHSHILAATDFAG